MNPVVITALLLTSFLHRCYIFNEKTNYFHALDSAFPRLYCLKLLFKSVDISKSYARKLKGLFSLKHGGRIFASKYISNKQSKVHVTRSQFFSPREIDSTISTNV